MIKGFWEKLEKPILALAPLYDVTDAAFRTVIAKYGKPDIMFTEFTSAEGLASKGKSKLIHQLSFSPQEHPIVAQLFGKTPDAFFEAAKLAASLGFDGVDLNTGCPEKNVVKQGSGAGLFRTPELTQEILGAMKAGSGGLPISVKIRIGDNNISWENWIEKLLETEPAAITVHLRTRKEMSKVPAHWEIMPDIVKFIHKNTTTENRPVILGNGDVNTLAEARTKVQETGCDGAMIGRGIFGNPWFFNRKREGEIIPVEEKMKVLLEHTFLFEEKFKGIKPFEVMKKHYKAYVTGFDSAKDLREKLYTAESATEVEEIIKTHNFKNI